MQNHRQPEGDCFRRDALKRRPLLDLLRAAALRPPAVATVARQCYDLRRVCRQMLCLARGTKDVRSGVVPGVDTATVCLWPGDEPVRAGADRPAAAPCRGASGWGLRPGQTLPDALPLG